MTVTETRLEADAADSTAGERVDPYDASGLAGALTTSDHKTIGKMYIFLGLFGGLLSVVLNFLVGLERTDISSRAPDIFTFGSDNQFFQVWSLGRTSMLFFCVLPLLIGLATYIVPLQVGSPSIAFPRAAAAAFWTWLIGIGIHVATVFVDGGLGAPEAQAAQGSDVEAIELSLLSIGVTAIAILLATICLATTVIAQRPQGMTLAEVPLFSWSILVAGGVWLLALPVWLANLAIAWFDFRGADAVRYGNVTNIWDELGWLFSQPMVFAFLIPVLGIVGDIVPVAVGRRQRSYGVQQLAIGGLGVLSFGAFAQPFFNVEVDQQPLFVIMSLLLVVPVLAFAGGLADTLVNGKARFSGYLVLAMLALLVLLAAVAAAAIRVAGSAIGVVRELDSGWLKEIIDPLEDLQGTVVATGVMHVVFGTAVLGAIAGLYYWGPKLFGRQLNAGAGVLAGLAVAGGTVLVGAADVVNGFLDEGDRVYDPVANAGVWDPGTVETLNFVGVAGIGLVGAGLVMVLLDLVVSVGLGKGSDEDADDPWSGHTLEWGTDSPPPLGNFVEAPVVHSERPLLDAEEGTE